MRTVGQVLKEERQKKFYTLDEVEKATKIRKELLEALEAGYYHKLPPPTFVQGFIKIYGKFLGLSQDKLLAIFRREFSEVKHPPRVLEAFTNPPDRKRFRFTPNSVVGAVVLTLVITFFIYLWIEYRFLVGGPYLEVSQPVNQSDTNSATIQVIGRADPESQVSINGQEIQIDSKGKFSQEIQLSENVNNIIVTATAKNGKASKVERTVFLKR